MSLIYAWAKLNWKSLMKEQRRNEKGRNDVKELVKATNQQNLWQLIMDNHAST